MKKIFLSLILVGVLSQANVTNAIEKVIGKNSFETNKNLINFIFNDKNLFTKYNGQLNYTKICKKLIENNLLKLNFNSNKHFLNVTFVFNNHPKKSLKITKNILRDLGYYYYFTNKSKRIDNKLIWGAKIKTAAAINPLDLSKELELRSSYLVDMVKEGENSWFYVIDTNNIKFNNLYTFNENGTLSLAKQQKDYLILANNAKSISIKSNFGNHWHPYVVFYDNNLNPIEIFKKNVVHRKIILNVPNNTKYILIKDIFTPFNIKRGLKLTKE